MLLMTMTTTMMMMVMVMMMLMTVINDDDDEAHGWCAANDSDGTCDYDGDDVHFSGDND